MKVVVLHEEDTISISKVRKIVIERKIQVRIAHSLLQYFGMIAYFIICPRWEWAMFNMHLSEACFNTSGIAYWRVLINYIEIREDRKGKYYVTITLLVSNHTSSGHYEPTTAVLIWIFLSFAF